jgi:hypothetical protein
MATLFVAAFASAAQVAMGPPLQEMTVDIGVGSTQSAVIVGSGRRHRYVRLFADANCFVTWNANPVAIGDGSDGRPLAANVAEYFNIESGNKIAVIERT